MTQTVHLLCGVPGSGKTWVANQLTGFCYLPHDDHAVSEYYLYLLKAARLSTEPVLAEAPFRISVLVDQLESRGIPVKTYYISEPEHIVRERYESRSRKPFPKQHTTNLARYNSRQWDVRGSSEQILAHLKGLTHA